MRSQIAISILVITLGCSLAANASVIGYSDHATWLAAVGATFLETFDGLPTGPVGSLPSIGVTSMSGTNAGGSAVGQFITNEFALPFPMFNPPLPSAPNFISNDMSQNGGFATGQITFGFSSPRTAIGAFVADSAPLGGFSIELFAGAMSLGSISVGPRTLPDSFVGITTDTPFTAAKFGALNIIDSWGLDNLEVSTAVTSVPEPLTFVALLPGFAALGFAAKRRKSQTS